MRKSVGVIVVTRNRKVSLLRTLGYLSLLPDATTIMVVDNNSTDGTVEAVRERFPKVELVRLSHNAAAHGRTIGAEEMNCPYIAFCDDDSWWDAGSLQAAADLFDQHSRLGLIAASVLVEPSRVLDKTCKLMARSPIPANDLPGRPILGFVACGALVRRSAFLEVGGFSERFGIMGEEALLSIDLASAGWGLAYVQEIVAHHHPTSTEDRSDRRILSMRNALWLLWLRRKLGRAITGTLRTSLSATRNRETRYALVSALKGLPWVVRERRPIPQDLEALLILLEQAESDWT